MKPSVLAAADFLATSALPPLPGGEIHLWFFPHWEKMAEATDSAPVRSRLAHYLGCAGEEVRIGRGEHGKPRVASAQLEFNLSHAGAALLLGVSRNIALGVDLELARRKTRPVLELARRFFRPAETAALERLAEPARQAAFLRLWCAKEAALKADGRGIGLGLDRVEFAIDSSGEVRAASGNPWHIVALRPSAAYIGAVAFRNPVSRVRAFVAPPEPAIAPRSQSG